MDEIKCGGEPLKWAQLVGDAVAGVVVRKFSWTKQDGKEGYGCELDTPDRGRVTVFSTTRTQEIMRDVDEGKAYAFYCVGKTKAGAWDIRVGRLTPVDMAAIASGTKKTKDMFSARE